MISKQIIRLVLILASAAVGATAQTNTFPFPSSGPVGIGTASPSSTLEVNGTAQFDGAVNASGHDAFTSTYSTVDGSTPFKNINGTNYAQFGQMGSNGFGIGNWANSAVLEGTDHLTLDSFSGNTYFQTGRNTAMTLLEGGNVGIGLTAPSEKLEVSGNLKLSGSGSHIHFVDGTDQSTAWTGTLTGGDYAESVDVTGDHEQYEPGDVLVLDPDHSDRFIKASERYSTAVAGVYSTKPGIVGRHQTTDKATATSEVPMAMVGIVPTKVCAENGPIRRGDLLVASSTPGYAMKGTDRGLLAGAVIGKAMEPLDAGTGLIKALISLQ